MFTKIKDIFTNTENPHLIDWVLYGLIVLICYLSFYYFDIYDITKASLVIWKTPIFNFFQYTQNNGMPHISYPYIVFLLLGIWNLPIWLAIQITGVDYSSGTYFYFLWAKLPGIISLLYSGKLIYDIAQDYNISKNDAKWCSFIYLTSIIVIASALVSSQIDIFISVFSLLALRSLNKNNTKAFLLWFALAISMKPFAVIILLPIVLLVYKKLYKVILFPLAGMSLYLILSILFTVFDPGYKIAIEYSDRVYGFYQSLLTDFFFVSGERKFSVFAIIYGLILFTALIVQPKDKEEQQKWIVWLSAISYISFYIFYNVFHYYWMILAVPFICLAMFQNRIRLYFSLCCNAIAELGCIIVASFSFTALFGIEHIYKMGIISKFFNLTNQRFTTMAEFFPNRLRVVYPQMWMVGMLLFLISVYPNNKISIPTFENLPIRLVVYGRFAITIMFVLGYLFCYLYR